MMSVGARPEIHRRRRRLHDQLAGRFEIRVVYRAKLRLDVERGEGQPDGHSEVIGAHPLLFIGGRAARRKLSFCEARHDLFGE